MCLLLRKQLLPNHGVPSESLIPFVPFLSSEEQGCAQRRGGWGCWAAATQSKHWLQGIKISEAGLAGEALWERDSGAVWRFPEAALPAGAPERFVALWAARPVWSAADIEPYVAGLQVALALSVFRSCRHSQISRDEADFRSVNQQPYHVIT